MACCCWCWVTSVVSDSVRPHRRQPTRLPRPWDSPGKNTGVGCRFLLQCMKVKSKSEVAQSCLTLSDPMDCSLPGSSIYGIFQARVLEWGAIASFLITYHWTKLVMWPRHMSLVREYNPVTQRGFTGKTHQEGTVNIFTSIQLTMIIILSMHYELNCVGHWVRYMSK